METEPPIWHVTDGQNTVRETDASLRQRIANGVVDPDTRVWRPGMADWTPAKDVPGLFIPPLKASSTLDANSPPPQSPPVLKSGGQSSYILRHWRGELGLGISYWVNCILGTMILGIAVGLLGLADITRHPQSITASFACLTLFGIVLSVWQLVGVWRSAGRSIQQRQRRLKWASWAGVARAVAFLEFVSLTVNAVDYQLPATYAMLQIAVGKDPTPPHSLRVLNGGKEIELAGGMDFGTAAELSKLLDTSPGVAVIDLDNIGGRVAEAKLVGDIISQRHLATYTAAVCASACTIAYMSGRPRYLGPNGKLGFHRYSFPGLMPFQELALNQQGQQDLVAAGVAPTFAATAFATPASNVWYPDAATLLAAHVVTRLTDGMAFSAAAGGQTTFTTQDAERILGSSASFAALKRHEPAIYARAIDTTLAEMRAGNSLQNFITRVREPIAAAVTKYLRVAGDDTQVRAARLTSEEARILAPDHPAECVAMWYGTSSPGQLPYIVHLSKDIQAKDNEVSAAIIDTGASDPSSSVATPEIADALMKRIILQVRGKTGIDPSSLTRTSSRPEDQRKICLALAAFLDEVAALPPSQAGDLMRYLFRSVK